MTTIQFIADRGDSQRRLDQALVRRVSGVSRLSRTLAQSWIAAGLVTVDGARASKASSAVREGATVEVSLPASTVFREVPRAEQLPLEVVYQDEHLLAVNKPAGMVVHPSFRNTSGTILNAVLWHIRDRPDVRPGLISRLDKDTSGVLLIALSEGSHARVQRDAHAGRVQKKYLAIVRAVPHPCEGTIALPLAHDPGDRRRIVVHGDGLPSETRYRTVSANDAYSIVECELVTGRTHQIRVHLAACGWPIAGDRVYGVADPLIARQALHASSIALPHPVLGTPLLLEASLPPDMQALMTNGGAHGS